MLPTTTIQNISRADPVRVLSLRSSTAICDYLEALLSIVEQHQRHLHPCSQQLLALATQLGKLVIHSFQETPVFFEQVVEHMQLLSKLLRNSLDNAPLRDPVIANGYVWEKWMYDHCRRLGIPSPFDQAPLEVAQPYTLAIQILGWKQDLLDSKDPYVSVLAERLEALANQEDASQWLDSVAVQGLSRQEAIIGYTQLAQLSLGMRGSLQLVTLAEKTDRYCGYLKTLATHSIQRQMTLTEARLGETERLVMEQTRQISHTYAQGMRSLEVQRDAERTANQALVRAIQNQEEVQQQLTLTVQDLTAQVGGLRQQLNQLAHQNEQNARAAARQRHHTTTVVCSIM